LQPDLYVNDLNNEVTDISVDILTINQDIVNIYSLLAGTTGITGPFGPTGPIGNTGAIGMNGVTGPTGSINLSVIAPLNAVDNNGILISGGNISTEFATATRPGIVSATTQSVLGDKTVLGTFTSDNLSLPSTVGGNTGCININGNRFIHSKGISDSGTFIGTQSGNFTLTGASNSGMGRLSLNSLTTGQSNSAYGAQSLQALTTGVGNSVCGAGAGISAQSIINCTLLGAGSATSLISGNENIIIGANALGSATSGNNIIELSNGTMGNSVSGDIRIGMGSNTLATYIAGIQGNTGVTGQIVVVNSGNRLGAQSLDNFLTQNYTMTLDSGSITGSTVRGALTSVVPISLTRIGKLVTMNIPALNIVTQSGAGATINITGISSLPVLYRPSFIMDFTVTMLNNASFQTGVLYVTSGGLVSLQLLSPSGFFTLPTGLGSYDVSVSWIVI
jgi:hypothetical protein